MYNVTVVILFNSKTTRPKSNLDTLVHIKKIHLINKLHEQKGDSQLRKEVGIATAYSLNGKQLKVSENVFSKHI